jgi:outer membrane protein
MRFFLSFLCISVLTVTLFAQKQLTLDEAVTTALHRNTTLEKAENNIRTYEADKLAAIGGFLPGVNAAGSFDWSRTSGPSVTIVNGIPFSSSSSEESRQYSAGVNANWTLFDGLSNFANLSRAENNLEAARLSLMRMKQDIVFQTVSYYYDIVNARQLLKVKEEDVKRYQKNLETSVERNKLGAVTMADVYAQQVQVGNAELEVIRTQNTLETAKATLLDYLGLDVLEEYTFVDTLTSDEQDLLKNRISGDYTNLKELVNLALETRPDFKSKKLNVESAEDAVTMAFSGHLPSLSGSGSFSTSSEKINNLFDTKRYGLGLTLSIPIFSGFSVQNQVQQAKVTAENTTVELTELEREIKRNIQTTFLDLQAAEKALEVGQRNVVAAEENRKIEEEKYNLGSGTILNVLIANSEYTNAVTNYINAQFSYIVLSEQLKYHLGNLDFNKFE